MHMYVIIPGCFERGRIERNLIIWVEFSPDSDDKEILVLLN